MSGTMKSGLLFGLIGLIVVLIVGFVPFIGALLCGPGGALLIGGAAGYFALRWNTGATGIGQSVLAGAIAGVGTLIGAVVFWIIAVSLASNDASLYDAIQSALAQQPNANQLDPQSLKTLVGLVGPAAGLCFGVLNLVLALAGGAVGALIARRNQPIAAPIAPPSVPPMS